MEQELPPVATIENAVRDIGNIFAETKKPLIRAADAGGFDMAEDEDEWTAT